MLYPLNYERWCAGLSTAPGAAPVQSSSPEANWHRLHPASPVPLPDAVAIGAMLRSWETRFGARLLRIGGDATLQVLVERPPRTMAAALRVAAEHRAFADEIPGTGDTVTSIAGHILGAPVWQFWWD